MIIGSRIEQGEAVGRHADLSRNDSFRTVDEAEGSFVGGCPGCGARGPQDIREFFDPVTFGAVQAGFQALQEGAVSDLSLAICLRVVY